MRHTTLIFDLDGTLADPRVGITRSFQHALERLGLPAPPLAELERLIGPPMREAFTMLLGSAVDVDRAVAVFRERYSTIGAFEAEVYPGMVEALEKLEARGARLFVATSKPHVYARAILEHFGLLKFFRAVYGCELSGERADKAELLRHLLAEEGLVPSTEIVMIGDRKHDIAGARANGLASIAVRWGFGSEDELREAGPDRICASIDELMVAIDPL